MKLMFQVDDFGITRGVTLGIIDGIENGLVRNTGLFVNTDATEFAVSFIKKYPHVCFGLDINLVAGYPITDKSLVPGLVDSTGRFITSIQRFNDGKFIEKIEGLVRFEEDPYVYEEVLLEVENQVLRYIELVGEKPPYIHPHSLSTPNTRKAMRAMAEKYEVPFSFDIHKETDVTRLDTSWNIKPLFKVEDQVNTDVTEHVINTLAKVEDKSKKYILVCHAGYIDDELLNLSTYTLIRARDLEMAKSDKLKQYVADNDIELITYRDLINK